MSEKTFGKGRKWLNPETHYDSGAVQWSVAADVHSVSSQFSIWDCSKKVSLDFDVYGDNSAEQRAKKIDILIEELTKLKAAMGEAYEYHIVEKCKDGEDE